MDESRKSGYPRTRRRLHHQQHRTHPAEQGYTKLNFRRRSNPEKLTAHAGILRRGSDPDLPYASRPRAHRVPPLAAAKNRRRSRHPRNRRVQPTEPTSKSTCQSSPAPAGLHSGSRQRLGPTDYSPHTGRVKPVLSWLAQEERTLSPHKQGSTTLATNRAAPNWAFPARTGYTLSSLTKRGNSRFAMFK